MTNLTTHRKRFFQIITLIWMIFLLLGLSCSVPFKILGGGSAEGNLEENLAESGLLFVDEVTRSGDQVVISYQILPEDDPEVMIAGWINALLAAAEAEPEASQYVLNTSLSGEPYLEIRADGLDVQALAAEVITVDLFLERLTVTDLQPLAKRVMGVLVNLGLNISEVRQSRDQITVEYYPAPAADQSELTGEWWSIFAALSEEELSVDTIEIRAVMPDTSVFVVTGDVEGLEAYLQGEITSFQYLAGLTVTEEPIQLEEGE